MKHHLFSAVLTFSIISASAQTAEVANTPFQEGPGCKTLSLNAADEIAAGLTAWDIERIDNALATVATSCGMSEPTLRLRILSKIMKREDTTDDVREYFDNEYYDRTISRVNASAAADYGYAYANRESWFGFVPLRHPVDSLSGKVARELLDVRKLTTDEQLLCVLFSGDVGEFGKKWNNRGIRDSYAGTYRKKLVENNGRETGSFVFYSGVYSPIGNKNIFGNSPTFGITLSAPVVRDVCIELGVKMRFHVNDQSFRYYAMDTTNEVNSDTGLFFGAIAGIKLYDRKNFIVQSRIGLGLESISTGLSEPSKNPPANNPNERDYFSVETLHTSVGLAAMKGVLRGKYVGVEVGLHVCPYGRDKNLLTPLDNVAASGEMFFRF